MHIMEGYLPMTHAVAWSVAAAPFVVHSARQLQRAMDADPSAKMRLAAGGAFTLLLTSLKIPSVAGSSSHPTGTGLGAVLTGPASMPVLAGFVLSFQAILLAHGGLTTLGANLVSLGIVGPWAAWGTWRAARRAGIPAGLAIGVASAIADLVTYATTSLQLALAFPQEVGGVPAAFVKFAAVFAATQLPLAVVEGVFAALVWRALGEQAASPMLPRRA